MADRAERIILTIAAEYDPASLEGRTFQIHVRDGDRIVLYPVRIQADQAESRCPVIIGGERCGDVAGHEGKHMWLRGD